jgi:hypothetical protein
LPDVRATPDAKRLYDDLLSGYNRSRTVWPEMFGNRGQNVPKIPKILSSKCVLKDLSIIVYLKNKFLTKICQNVVVISNLLDFFPKQRNKFA